MAYNKNLYTSSTSALDAGIVYDQTETKMQSEINADLKNTLTQLESEVLNDALYFTNQSLTVTTGQLLDLSDNRITTNHVLARIEFSDPSKIASDVNWNTDTAGHFKLTNGTCTGTCSVNIVLVKKS